MALLKERLDALAKALGLQTPLLQRARRRYRAFHKRAYKAMQQKEAAQAAADQARAGGHLALATRKDKKALRLEAVELKNRTRKQFWLGRIKVLTQRIEELEADHAKLAAELKKAHKVTAKGNKVEGGTARGRIGVAIHAAAHNCSTGAQRNYYSMSGASPDLGHTLKGMPYGHRFDCSSFATGIYYVCGLPDPNGGGYAVGETMYTGSLGEHGKRVSEADAKTGDFVLYGPAPHHHVEIVDNPKLKTTVGHGSAPIDGGIFDLFGDGDYEIRSYV